MKTENIIARECGFVSFGDEANSNSLRVIARKVRLRMRCRRSNPVAFVPHLRDCPTGLLRRTSLAQPNAPRNDTPFSFICGAKNFVVIMLLCILSVNLQAQPFEPKPQKTIIGIWSDLLYNKHATNFNFFPQFNVCGKFTEGNGLKPSFGIFSDIPLSQSRFELHASLGYKNLSGQLTAPPVDTMRRDINGSLVRVDREHRLTSSVNALSADALLSWHSPVNVILSAGPSFSWLPAAPTYLQTEHITSPSGTVYTKNNQSIDTLGTGDIPNASRFLTSAVLRASYRFPFKRNFVLVPQFEVAVPLNRLSDELSWNIASYGVGIGIGYQTPPELPPFIDFPLPPEPIPTKKNYALAAALTVSGLDEQGARVPAPAIYLGKTIVNEEIALVPAIFFDSASSTIPSRYKSRNTTNIIVSTVDSVANVNALDVAHNILNIAAKRMQERPLAHIRLTGAAGITGVERKNISLAQARAEVVKEYLVNTWNIDPTRISITAREIPEKPSNTATAYGREENRRVDIASDEYEILRPFETHSVEKRYASPPGLLINPRYLADTSITDWKISIRTKTAEITHFGGEDVSELIGSQHIWTIDPNKISDTDDSVNVVLELGDILSNHAESRAGIPVVRTWQQTEKHYAVPFENIEIERFNVITFDFDKGKLLESEKRRLEHAEAALTSDATLRVTGYADLVTGDVDYNKKLSADRAHDVAKIITDRSAKPKEIFVEAEGAKDLFDNSLPEGRFLSRTVRIEITKPIK